MMDMIITTARFVIASLIRFENRMTIVGLGNQLILSLLVHL